VIHAQALDLVQRKQDTSEEQLVLLLEGKRETVDDRTQDLQELGNTVESLGFVGELEKDIIDGPANVRSEIQEFAVDAMEGGLEEVSLAGVFRVKKFQELAMIRRYSSE
jgi:hypothetical protein